MSTFTAIDLTQLPKPTVIEELDYEVILNEMATQLNGLQPLLFDEGLNPILLPAELYTADNGEQYFRVPANQADLSFVDLESDPSAKLLEIVAYREMLLRQRINNAAYATMLAYATGADLEQEAARFGIERLLITPADNSATPPVEAVYESDTSLRRRTQLALEGFSTAGPIGAYIFHALSASGQVKDVSVQKPIFKYYQTPANIQAELPQNAIVLIVEDDAGLVSPLPGDVVLNVLSTEGDGTASNALLGSVEAAVSEEDVRPLTDNPRIRSSAVFNYQIEAELIFYDGPDRSVVMAAAQAAAEDFANQHHKNGQSITLSKLYAALNQTGVYKVNLISPVFDQTEIIPIDVNQAAYCTNIILTDGGVYGD